LAGATALVASVGAANGVCELDGAALVPAARIPTDLAAYQPSDAYLSEVAAFVAAAQTAASDSEGNPIPKSGYWMIDTGGDIALVPAPEMDMAPVNAAITSALASFTVDRDLDDMMTATEAYLAFLPAMTPDDLREYLASRADSAIVWDVPFMGQYAPLVGSGIGTGGSAASTTGEAGHPGCTQFLSGTVSGGGYKVYGHNKAGLITGKAACRAVVKTPASFTGMTSLVGFTSSGSMVEPDNGLYFWRSGSGVVTPKTAKATVATSGATYTLSAGTWYTFKISLNAAGTAATFEILNDAGTVLSSSVLTTNIPAVAGEEVGPAVMATSTDTSGALQLLLIDHFSGTMPA
jgi:hypothetical protein